MEHTWQSDYLPKLDISNLDAGDVAICAPVGSGSAALGDLDEDRVCFVAPLRCRSDLEWLLRGLLLHPNIRHLVLCGDDHKVTGEALVALWQKGLDEMGRLPGSRGSLSPELDAASVETLRDYVRIVDLRGKPLSDVARSIVELPALSQEMKPRALPNPEIPERKIFFSRKTTFPIFSSDVGDSWLQLLNLALKIGTEKETANGERIAEALNAVVTIETPVLEDGEQQAATFPEFLDFNRDDFDRFCSSDHYDQRHRDPQVIDQLEEVCDRLKISLDSRSGTMVYLDPGDIAKRENPSELISATFNVTDGRLFGSFVLRSIDVYTDWPLEAMTLVELQRQVAERLELEIGSSAFIIHSAHLYERDFDRSLRVLRESFKRPLPLHVDPSGVFLFGNDGGSARGMLLSHDSSAIFWEDAFSDPEDLSWYIVDTMPWLLPQHIRYVGQECAALMRAMKDGECYLQG